MVSLLENLAQVTQGPVTNNHIKRARLADLSRENWLRRVKTLSFPNQGDSAAWGNFEEKAFQSAHDAVGTEIHDLLNQLSNPNGIDALVIENVPHVEPGPQPTDGARPVVKSAVSEAVLVGLAKTAGLRVFGYLQEKGGSLVHEVAPESGKEETQSNYGRTLFSYHVDNTCFSDQFQPEYLFLIGLLNQGDVVTRLLRLEDDVLPNVPVSLLDTLRKPIFRFGIPQSFEVGGFMLASPPRAVIYEDAFGMQHIAWPSRAYRQDSQEAQTAMSDFRAFLDTLVPQRIVVKPGVVLAFRNSRVLHGREPIPTIAMRWLQRVYASHSLAAHQEATNTGKTARVFDVRLLVMA
jgi:hypothetical protein